MPIIKSSISSLDKNAFFSLRDNIAEIIVNGYPVCTDNIESDFNKYIDIDRQYKIIASLFDNISGLYINKNIRDELIETLKNNIDESKENPMPTFKEFVDSFDLESLKKKYYQDAVISLHERTGGFINKSHEYSTIDGLVQYYKDKVEKANEEYPKQMANYYMKDFDKNISSIVQHTVFEHLLILNALNIDAEIIKPVPEQEDKYRVKYSLNLSSSYNSIKGIIDIAIDYSTHKSDLTVMKPVD